MDAVTGSACTNTCETVLQFFYNPPCTLLSSQIAGLLKELGRGGGAKGPTFPRPNTRKAVLESHHTLPFLSTPIIPLVFRIYSHIQMHKYAQLFIHVRNLYGVRQWPVQRSLPFRENLLHLMLVDSFPYLLILGNLLRLTTRSPACKSSPLSQCSHSTQLW